jgi:hypothetical protein
MTGGAAQWSSGACQPRLGGLRSPFGDVLLGRVWLSAVGWLYMDPFPFL